eukprot:CFRG4862T1
MSPSVRPNVAFLRTTDLCGHPQATHTWCAVEDSNLLTSRTAISSPNSDNRHHVLQWLEERSNAKGLLGRFADDTYSTLMNQGFVTPFFKKGWGDLDIVDFQRDHAQIEESLARYPKLEISWKLKYSGNYEGTIYDVFEGSVDSPVIGRAREWLPEEARSMKMRLIRPRHISQPDLTLHLAGTGDHGFNRRHLIALPLVSHGIASLILESPYYGTRKPLKQVRSKLLYVCDLLVLGYTTIVESLHLLRWGEQNGYGRLCVSGFSMGGVHAAMVSCVSSKPVACSPHLAPHSAAQPFCHGPLWKGTELYRNPSCFSAPVRFTSPHGRLDEVKATGNVAEVTRKRLECAFSITDVTGFPEPIRPDAAVFVAGLHDRYVPLDSATRLQSHFDGSLIYTVNGGHVSSFLMFHDIFRDAVVTAINRL